MSATPQDPSEYADRMLAALDTMYAENAPAATKRHLLKAVLTLFRDESLASRPEERTGTCQCDETGTAHSVCVKRGCQGSLAEPPRGGGEREAKIRPEYEVMDARQLFTVAAEWIRTASPTNPYGGALASVLFARAEALLSAPSPSEPTREGVEEEMAERIIERLGLDPNDGDVDSADPVDWVVAAVEAERARLEDSAPVPSAARETGWLIEYAEMQDLGIGKRPTWVKAIEEDGQSWRSEKVYRGAKHVPTHDASEAIRFVRESDAHAVLSLYGESDFFKVTDHEWSDPFAVPSAAPAREEVTEAMVEAALVEYDDAGTATSAKEHIRAIITAALRAARPEAR